MRHAVRLDFRVAEFAYKGRRAKTHLAPLTALCAAHFVVLAVFALAAPTALLCPVLRPLDAL